MRKEILLVDKKSCTNCWINYVPEAELPISFPNVIQVGYGDIHEDDLVPGVFYTFWGEKPLVRIVGTCPNLDLTKKVLNKYVCRAKKIPQVCIETEMSKRSK